VFCESEPIVVERDAAASVATVVPAEFFTRNWERSPGSVNVHETVMLDEDAAVTAVRVGADGGPSAVFTTAVEAAESPAAFWALTRTE
jgi:hypothetical protein